MISEHCWKDLKHVLQRDDVPEKWRPAIRMLIEEVERLRGEVENSCRDDHGRESGSNGDTLQL